MNQLIKRPRQDIDIWKCGIDFSKGFDIYLQTVSNICVSCASKLGTPWGGAGSGKGMGIWYIYLFESTREGIFTCTNSFEGKNTSK